jgi:hypothetical protein
MGLEELGYEMDCTTVNVYISDTNACNGVTIAKLMRIERGVNSPCTSR